MSDVRYDRPALIARSRAYGRRQCILNLVARWSRWTRIVSRLRGGASLACCSRPAGMSGVDVVVRLTGAGAGSILREV